jgi:alpha-tubulin suppressor-like RCC1 family protein
MPVTVAQDATLRLWDVTDPARPRAETVLRRDGTLLNAVTWVAGGKALLTAGADGRLQMWGADVAGAVRYTGERESGPISREEWRQYVPDLAHQEPCVRQ